MEYPCGGTGIGQMMTAEIPYIAELTKSWKLVHILVPFLNSDLGQNISTDDCHRSCLLTSLLFSLELLTDTQDGPQAQC
jgi:hypothetical protein